MSDIDKLVSTGKEVAKNVSQLISICTPRPDWLNNQDGWRHKNTKGIELKLFLLTKLAGSISTANAMLLLVKSGFRFQAGILARSIREANLSIAYMLPKPNMKEGDYPTKKQKKALDEFYKETWPVPEHPFEVTDQRSQILLKELSAGLGHFQSKDSDISKHDAGQVALQVLRLLSDYTHMAYPRLMELWEPERGYVMSKKQNGPSLFNFDQIAGIIHDCCNIAECIALFMVKLYEGLNRLSNLENNTNKADMFLRKLNSIKSIKNNINKLYVELENNFSIPTANSKKILREFKGKQ